MHVRKGDLVQILAGRDKGKQGKIVRSLPKENRVVVEKVNIVKRHQKPSPNHPQGGIISMEAPVHVSNVQVVCKGCKKPTRPRRELREGGAKVRVCRHCGAALE